MLAYSISASAAAAAAAPATCPASRLAGRAGNARITASASIRSGATAGPTVSRQPAGVLASSRTVALVLTCAPLARASASGSMPRPPASVVKTGAGGAVGSPPASIEAAASASDRYDRDAGHLRDRELAPGSRRRLEHDHLGAAVTQEVRGCQAGDASADNRDPAERSC